MKKIRMLSILACICMCFTLFSSVAFASESAYVLSKNSWPVNLRSAATRSSDVLDLLVTGTKVTVLDKGSEWTKIRVGNLEGYIMSTFLTSSDPFAPGNTSSTSKSGTPIYIVSDNGKSINVRTGPGTDYPVLEPVPSGTKATLLESGNTWSKVKTDDITGFVKTEYLTKEKPTETPKDKPVTRYVQSVNSAPVNMRQKATRSSEVVAELVTGTEVKVLSTSGNWSEISVGSQTGWIKSLYLSANKPGEYLTEDSYTAYVTSPNGGAVRMRYGAGTGYHVVTSLKVGTEVTVLTSVQGWARVRSGSYEGYINETYLTTKRP